MLLVLLGIYRYASKVSHLGSYELLHAILVYHKSVLTNIGTGMVFGLLTE